MKFFVSNLLLALIWAAMTGRINGASLVVGFVVGYAVLAFVNPGRGSRKYFLKIPQVLGFVLFFVWELARANLRVAWEVVTPTHHMKPGIVAIPLDAETDTEITLLANLITLTPGTLSLDVSQDRKILYLHAMYVEDPDKLRRQIKDGFERRLLEILR